MPKKITASPLLEEGFVRLPQVLSLFGVQKSKIWAMVKDGTFPTPQEVRTENIALGCTGNSRSDRTYFQGRFDMNNLQQFLTGKEVAHLCRVSPCTVENWRRRQQGPQYTKTETGHILYPLDSVLHFISGYRSKIVCPQDDRSISQ